MLVSGLANAQTDNDTPWDKFGISIGGFVTTSDTQVQLNSATLGVGAVIDLENTLGVETDFQTYRIDMNYRFGESRRHEIEFHYFDSKRSGSRTLDQDIQIGDIVFEAGTGVNTEFDLMFANLDYVYNFLMDDRVRLGVSAGLHTAGIGLKIEETGGAKIEDEEFTAPLPMIGLRSEVLLTERWRLKMDFNFFYLEYDNYTGQLSDSIIAVEFRPWKNFGLGAGVNNITYTVQADTDDTIVGLNGEIEFTLTGLMLYGKYFF
jgi:hypothetical protein